VVYYDTIDQARRDGYRACQKCKPDDVAFYGQREEVVVKALEILWSKQNDGTMKSSLKALSAEVGVTPSYLCRVFKKTMGITVGEYMKQFEMQTSEGVVSEPSSNPMDPSIVSSGCQLPDFSAVSSLSSGYHCYVQATNVGGQNKDCPSMFVDAPAHLPIMASSGVFEPSSQLCIRDEEAFDLNFDFDEWVWTEGFNFEDWISSSSLNPS
jgi:AraC-like DNA-binding protein